MILLDTSAWVEYFIGSRKGLKVEALLKLNEKIATPLIVLLEFACKSLRDGIDFGPQIDFIKTRSVIVGFDENLIAKRQGIMLKLEEKSGNSVFQTQ